ncbi:MAG: flagellar basal body rod protein FlgB [bacterium]
MPESVVKLLEKSLDYTSVKQKIISQNISNVNTANYRRKDVEFDELFSENVASELKATNPKHIGFTNMGENNLKIIDDPSAENPSGLNNVDMDNEMADMAQNSIVFKFAARKLNGYYRTLQEVIKGTKI